VRAEEVARWLLVEDTGDEGAWTESLKTWVREVVTGRETEET
jgi:hypothetical protein